METLASDVEASRKWLDAAKSQRDKQPDNYAITVSFQKYDSFYTITADFRIVSLPILGTVRHLLPSASWKLRFHHLASSFKASINRLLEILCIIISYYFL